MPRASSTAKVRGYRRTLFVKRLNILAPLQFAAEHFVSGAERCVIVHFAILVLVLRRFGFILVDFLTNPRIHLGADLRNFLRRGVDSRGSSVTAHLAAHRISSRAHAASDNCDGRATSKVQCGLVEKAAAIRSRSRADWRGRTALVSHQLDAFRTETSGDRLRHGQLRTATTALAFVPNLEAFDDVLRK